MNMKNILKIALLVSILLPLASCEKQPGAGDCDCDYIEVTANNIAGDWMLESWEGGQMAEGVCVYLRFVRKDMRYQMYSNVGSMYFVRRTGDFLISTDEILGSVLSGIYDYTLGEEWNHRYSVLLTADTMVLTAVDDPEIVCTYVRTEIPAGIVDSFPPVEE